MKFNETLNLLMDDKNYIEKRQLTLLLLLTITLISITLVYMIFYYYFSFIIAVYINALAALSYLFVPVYLYKGKITSAKLHLIITFYLNIFVLSFLLFSKEANLHYYLLAVPMFLMFLFGFKNRYINNIFLVTALFSFIYLELHDLRIFILPLSPMQTQYFSTTSLFGLSSVIFFIVWYTDKLNKKEEEKLNKTILELKKAHAEVKTLKGLLPICAKCKNIKNDGSWKRLEAYITENSDATFSHGLCPDCAEEIYGQQPWFNKNELES